MQRWNILLSGVIVLLSGHCAAVSEWPIPYFIESATANENVTWIQESSADTMGVASVLEGTSGEAEIMRLSYKTDGSDIPDVTYSGVRGLGLKVKKDTHQDTPFYLVATEPGDFEGGEQFYTIIVNALGGGSSGTVLISLVNVNDNPPTIESPAECKFEENLKGRTNCEFVVSDADGGACYVEMKVDDPHFEFHQTSTQTSSCYNATFVLVVIDELDFEKYRLHSLKITAKDDGQTSETEILMGYQERVVSFVVDVIDMPDEPPVWVKIVSSIAVDEKQEWKEQLEARDGDNGINWPIEYRLEFTPEYIEYRDYFDINENGVLSGKKMNRDELKREIFKIEVVATEVPQNINEFEAESVTNTIVVLVNDINDNSPIIEPEANSYCIDEGTAFQIRDFQVFDPDLADFGSFNIRLLDSQWSDNFLLVPSSGYQSTWISVTAKDPSLLDYETPSWRNIALTIEAEEYSNTSHVGFATISISLEDIIDEPPEFQLDEYETEIPENQPPNTFILQTVATDKDENDIITLSMSSKNLAINETGHITTLTNNAFDYERQTEVILQVTARDKANYTAFCQVTIRVIDLNDEPPTLVMPSEQEEIEEHSEINTPVSGDITATDPDSEAFLTFDIDWSASVAYKQGIALRDKALYNGSIKLANVNEHNKEWKTHLEVADKDMFDWEVFDSMKIQITVTDETTHDDYEHNKIRSAFLTVIVNDTNDCSPEFTQKSWTFTVTENTPPYRLIDTVRAIDNDSEPFSEISYAIKPVSPEGLVNDEKNPRIRIDETTGQIFTTSTEIDCDEWQELKFVYNVSATDGKYTDYATIILDIQDTNDVTPILEKPIEPKINTEVEEHTAGRLKVGCITESDQDVTEDYHTITYYIEGVSLKLFEMDEHCLRHEECCLWAIDGCYLDREIEPFHVIQVNSRDNFKNGIKVNSNEGPIIVVNVTLLDINDNDPVFEVRETPFQLFESKLPADSLVFSVGVSDKDIGDNGEIECIPSPKVTLTYPERPNADTQSLFTVKTFGNQCRVYATKDLIKQWGMYTFNISAKDKGEKPLYGFGIYELNVTNENLNAPEITFPVSDRPILLGREQTVNSFVALKDINGDDLPDFTAVDKDDPATPNGQVSFFLEGSDVFYLYLSTINTAVLRMRRIPAIGDRKFSMKITAKDKAELNSKESEEVHFDIYVLNNISSPEFTVETEKVSFPENSTGLLKRVILPEAINFDEEPLDYRRPIYYFIIEGDTDKFILNSTTRELSLKEQLDYEEKTEHILQVIATHSNELPDAPTLNERNVLTVTVEVIDENDMAPRFTHEVFSGTFNVNHESGQKVAEVKAEDPDTNDEISYELKNGTVKAKDKSLEEFESDDSFVVERTTGVVKLNLKPNNRVLSGYLEFTVIAYDLLGSENEDHRDEATVQIFVVSTAHQVLFNFHTPVAVVEASEEAMRNVFSEVLGYICTVEKIVRSNRSNTGVETTDVLTHFLDDTGKEPVLRDVIKNQFLDSDTYGRLYSEMSEFGLSLSGFQYPGTDKENRSYTTIVLAAVCAVLTVLVVVFSLAFVVRTRTLNQRLDKLSSTKTLTQDSGMKREAMAVPGTNQHAMEGSNPVWNTVMHLDYDTNSVGSGDSDLIGIEDSLEFGGEKARLEGGPSEAVGHRGPSDPFAAAAASAPWPADGPRRASLNPLAAAAGGPPALPSYQDAVDFPRRLSLNPLAAAAAAAAAANGRDTPPFNALANANFSFQHPKEPTTEL